MNRWLHACLARLLFIINVILICDWLLYVRSDVCVCYALSSNCINVCRLAAVSKCTRAKRVCVCNFTLPTHNNALIDALNAVDAGAWRWSPVAPLRTARRHLVSDTEIACTSFGCMCVRKLACRRCAAVITKRRSLKQAHQKMQVPSFSIISNVMDTQNYYWLLVLKTQMSVGRFYTCFEYLNES